MLQKPNFTFVTYVTLKTNVMTPKQIGLLRGLWVRDIPGINIIAAILAVNFSQETIRTEVITMNPAGSVKLRIDYFYLHVSL